MILRDRNASTKLGHENRVLVTQKDLQNKRPDDDMYESAHVTLKIPDPIRPSITIVKIVKSVIQRIARFTLVK